MWAISLPHWWEFVVRAVVVYLFLLVLLRLTGKRQVGQLAPLVGFSQVEVLYKNVCFAAFGAGKD